MLGTARALSAHALKRMAWGATGVADAETMEILVPSPASANVERVDGAAEAAANLGWRELTIGQRCEPRRRAS